MGAYLDLDDAAGPHPVAVRELAALRAEVADLRRWRSTHAPRLDALAGLLHAAQHEAHAGREAVATLASERAANARLTGEVEALRDDILRIGRWHVDAMAALDEARTGLDFAVAAERERWQSVVAHAVAELEALDEATAQIQAAALRELVGPNVAGNRIDPACRGNSG